MRMHLVTTLSGSSLRTSRSTRTLSSLKSDQARNSRLALPREIIAYVSVLIIALWWHGINTASQPWTDLVAWNSRRSLRAGWAGRCNLQYERYVWVS